MIRVVKFELLCVIWLCVACAFNALAESPQGWLERMAAAYQKYNYQGTLVHMCDGKMDIVHIVHRVDNGRVTERTTSTISKTGKKDRAYSTMTGSFIVSPDDSVSTSLRRRRHASSPQITPHNAVATTSSREKSIDMGIPVY